MANMQSNWKITYVEPSFLKSLALKIVNFYTQIRVPTSKNKNIHIISFPQIPFIDKWRQMRKLNELLLIFFLKCTIAIGQIEDPVFMFYNPRFAHTIKAIKHSICIYDIVDDKMQFKAVPAWLEEYHNFLIKECTFITVSSSSLFQKVSTRRKRDLYLVENGVDSQHFYRQEAFANAPRKELEKIRSPIIGYSGAIGEWFDFDLLDKLLAAREDISVVIIGWVFNDQRDSLRKVLDKHKNLYFLGRRSYSTLPTYLGYLSAGIIPFKINNLTNSINPIKLLEYLAAGLPVVSTAMPEVLKYSEGVYVSETSEQFIHLVDKVLTSSHDKRRLTEIAFRNDWKYKIPKFTAILENYLQRCGKKSWAA